MANINDVYDEFTEKDWRLFRDKIIVWQNNYIDKTNKEYIEILKQDKDPAELFWELENRIYHDIRKKGIVIEKKSLL